MTPLRPGITGFGSGAEVDYRTFKAAAYRAAASAGAAVEQCAQAKGVTPSFHAIRMKHPDWQRSVLCNRVFPFIVVVSDPVSAAGVQPVDCPEIEASMRQYGFESAPAAELVRALAAKDLAALNHAEQEQARYWKPTRVVDVIFNWWD
ncbi:MAG: hypothetical protein CMJ58_05605 [Planctomycetaceae bacterium]|nr:hypothetical protein [Planctomycetaceae bacterium]